MNKEDYEKFFHKNGAYILPAETFNELFDDYEFYKKENQNLKQQIDKASDILKRGIGFCINDSHNAYEKCNIAINREKDILKILKESESKE